MCDSMGSYNPDGNKTLVCTVGDLKPGDRYRTPDGGEFMVTDATVMPGGVNIVNLANGQLDTEGPGVSLGRDRQGRLYASRYLNPQVLEVEDEIVPFELSDDARATLEQ